MQRAPTSTAPYKTISAVASRTGTQPLFRTEHSRLRLNNTPLVFRVSISHGLLFLSPLQDERNLEAVSSLRLSLLFLTRRYLELA